MNPRSDTMRLVLKRYAAFSICARTYASTAAKPGNGPSPLTGSGAVPRHLSSLRGPSRRSGGSPRRQSGPEFAEAPADLARCYCAGGETDAGAAEIEAPGTRDVAADFAAAFVVWFDPATSAFSIGIRVPSRCGAGGSRLRGAGSDPLLRVCPSPLVAVSPPRHRSMRYGPASPCTGPSADSTASSSVRCQTLYRPHRHLPNRIRSGRWILRRPPRTLARPWRP